MLVGQIADAIATPCAGLISDASSGCRALNLGRRKWIYSLGAAIVALSMFFMFGYCVPYMVMDHPSQLIVTIYACICAAVLNIGWAMANVSEPIDRLLFGIFSLTNCMSSIGISFVILNGNELRACRS
jgi:Na+/melibiose symporter-like transporter